MGESWYLLECGHYGVPTPPDGFPRPEHNGFGEMVGCLPCSGAAAGEGKTPTVMRHAVKQVAGRN